MNKIGIRGLSQSLHFKKSTTRILMNKQQKLRSPEYDKDPELLKISEMVVKVHYMLRD